MSTKKFTRIWSIVIALVLILAIAVTCILQGPLYTVMNMYFGKGEADTEAEDWIKEAHETVFDPETDELLGNVSTSVIYTEETPTYGASNGLQLIDLRGAAYDDEAWDLLLDELDLDEVLNMLANAGFNTAELNSVGKPATVDYDGPMGWSTWVSSSGEAAVVLGFPAEEVLAATWNTDLAEEYGKLIGEQGLYNGFQGWYAPAMNTHRSAFGGRNYEYYSEDGFLAGKMGASELSGLGSMGTFAYIKHFALNDKEDGRNGIATWANEQAIREIYLRPFEISVKEATCEVSYYDDNNELQTREMKATTAIMSSYNRIGNTWSGARYGLMTTILRDEWGFEGAVISDYYGGSAYMLPDSGVRAGNDMFLNTFADGSMKETASATARTAIRKAAHHVLYMIANSNAMQGIVSGSTITYKLATWQKLMIAGDVLAVLVAGLGVYMIAKKKKSSAAVSVEEK